jgi:hypothetical protein
MIRFHFLCNSHSSAVLFSITYGTRYVSPTMPPWQLNTIIHKVKPALNKTWELQKPLFNGTFYSLDDLESKWSILKSTCIKWNLTAMKKNFSSLQFCNMQVSLHNNKSCHLLGSVHCLKQCWNSFDFKKLKVKNNCTVTTTLGLTTSAMLMFSNACFCISYLDHI